MIKQKEHPPAPAFQGHAAVELRKRRLITLRGVLVYGRMLLLTSKGRLLLMASVTSLEI